MIKHIVFWRVKGREDGQSREETARAIKEKIDGLRGRIPGMLHIEGGVDFSDSETSGDVVLYSEFEEHARLGYCPFNVRGQAARTAESRVHAHG